MIIIILGARKSNHFLYLLTLLTTYNCFHRTMQRINTVRSKRIFLCPPHIYFGLLKQFFCIESVCPDTLAVTSMARVIFYELAFQAN